MSNILMNHYGNIKSLLKSRGVYFKGLGDCELYLTDDEEIFFSDDLKLEAYTGFLGSRTLCNMGSFSYSWSFMPAWLTVGRYCSIATGLQFLGPRHPFERISSSPFTYDPDFAIAKKSLEDLGINGFEVRTPPNLLMNNVVIGHDVWIGANVTLGNSVTIGNGAVIAANSVVVKDVPPFAIIGGNPAKVIRMRFADDIIERIQRLEWWNYHFSAFKDSDFGVEQALDALEQLIEANQAINFNPPILTAEDIRYNPPILPTEDLDIE